VGSRFVMINSVTNVTPALAGWFDPGQARQREVEIKGVEIKWVGGT